MIHDDRKLLCELLSKFNMRVIFVVVNLIVIFSQLIFNVHRNNILEDMHFNVFFKDQNDLHVQKSFVIGNNCSAILDGNF